MDIFDNFCGARNGVIQCTCGWTYVPTDDDDSQNHGRHHAEFERVTKSRRHAPWSYTVRERMKDVGRVGLRVAVTDAEVFAAAELIVRAWFDRSFSLAIERGFGDRHPTVPEYAKWLADQEEMDPRMNEVILSIYRHVGRPPGTLGSSIWNPSEAQLTSGGTLN